MDHPIGYTMIPFSLSHSGTTNYPILESFFKGDFCETSVGWPSPGSYGRRMALAATELAKATAATAPKKAILFAGSFGSLRGKGSTKGGVAAENQEQQPFCLLTWTNVQYDLMMYDVYIIGYLP